MCMALVSPVVLRPASGVAEESELLGLSISDMAWSESLDAMKAGE